jgi:hypothetical protein
MQPRIGSRDARDVREDAAARIAEGGLSPRAARGWLGKAWIMERLEQEAGAR